MRASDSRGLRGLAVFFPAFLLLSLLAGLWIAATPVFASPDENAHAAKAIAQAHGQLLGTTGTDSRFPVYSLPDGYRYPASITCFAFYPNASGSCGAEMGGSTGTDFFDDWVSTYNPLYYDAVGWPTLLVNGSAGIYAMRIVSALICSALLAGAFVAAMGGRRARWMPAALAFFGAPMVSFLSASVSPQAMEFSAAALLTASLLRLVQTQAHPDEVRLAPRWLWIMTVIGACLLAVARATGPLWVVLIVAGVFTVGGWRQGLGLLRRPVNWIAVGIIAIAGLGSIAWTLFTGTLSGQAVAGDAPLVGAGPLSGAGYMLRSTPAFIQSAAGIFGWEDTPLPALVYCLFFGALVLLAALALVATGRRYRLVVVGALLAAILIPVIVQAVSVSRTGIIWQGRYGLFLYLSVILVLGWALSRAGQRIAAISAATTLVINALLAAYAFAAFFFVLHRYVVGMDGKFSDMLSAPQWQPPLGWIALTAIAVPVVLAFFGWVTWLGVRAARLDAGRVLVPASRDA